MAEFVENAITRGQRPVSIAGDCCSSIGVLAGLQIAGVNPTLIWLDAHGDFNTWETTPSGFLGGMPLAMIVGRGEQTMPHAVGLRSFPESRVILSDARDLDPDEKKALAASAVNHLKDIRTVPDHPLIAGPLYVHIDADVINPNDAPAMSYLAPGGASATEMETIFRRLARSGRVIAVSLSAWNPDLDLDRRSQSVCMRLLNALIERL
jgi:arginase